VIGASRYGSDFPCPHDFPCVILVGIGGSVFLVDILFVGKVRDFWVTKTGVEK
jgi:hypothetical protein